MAGTLCRQARHVVLQGIVLREGIFVLVPDQQKLSAMLHLIFSQNADSHMLHFPQQLPKSDLTQLQKLVSWHGSADDNEAGFLSVCQQLLPRTFQPPFLQLLRDLFAKRFLSDLKTCKYTLTFKYTWNLRLIAGPSATLFLMSFTHFNGKEDVDGYVQQQYYDLGRQGKTFSQVSCCSQLLCQLLRIKLCQLKTATMHDFCA